MWWFEEVQGILYLMLRHPDDGRLLYCIQIWRLATADFLTRAPIATLFLSKPHLIFIFSRY
jgi:hypothetical protein